MLDCSRAYADVLYRLVNPIHELLDAAHADLQRVRDDLPVYNGTTYPPALVESFKGFVLANAESGVLDLGDLLVYRDNGSVIFEDRVSGLKMSLRRPLQNRSGHVVTSPITEDIPGELALFSPPRADELIMLRRPHSDDVAGLVWKTPRNRGDRSHWGLQFVLAAWGSTLDSMELDLRLNFPLDAECDAELSGFVPDNSPLRFLDAMPSVEDTRADGTTDEV